MLVFRRLTVAVEVNGVDDQMDHEEDPAPMALATRGHADMYVSKHEGSYQTIAPRPAVAALACHALFCAWHVRLLAPVKYLQPSNALES